MTCSILSTLILVIPGIIAILLIPVRVNMDVPEEGQLDECEFVVQVSCVFAFSTQVLLSTLDILARNEEM